MHGGGGGGRHSDCRTVMNAPVLNLQSSGKRENDTKCLINGTKRDILSLAATVLRPIMFQYVNS